MSIYPQIITSVLDNDLYAFTMSQAALEKYPYYVTDDQVMRSENIKFPELYAQELREQIDLMGNLSLSDQEAAFLKRKCYFLKSQYIEWFRSYHYDPKEIDIKVVKNHVEVRAHGRFCRTVYWETPVLALMSELYYLMTKKKPDGQYINRAKAKGLRLKALGARFSEFGTRRRFSKEVQINVLRALIETAGLSSEGGVLNGTSNVLLAMLFDITPMGTNAHKWYQLHQGMFGIRIANKMALEAWQSVYDTRLGIALTDTFTTDEFLKCFDRHSAMLHDGVRQDSGDPIEYVDKIVAHYKAIDIDPMSKTILFSDSLNLDKVEEILLYCKDKIKCAFGIGTFFTNDILDVVPLKIVMKQVAVYLPDGRKVWTVKISDDPVKSSGDQVAQLIAKYEIGLLYSSQVLTEQKYRNFSITDYQNSNTYLSVKGEIYPIFESV